MATQNKIIDSLRAMAEIYGRNMSPMAATMFAADVSEYPEDQVLAALTKCRRELKTFPTVADIISRIQQADGRPSVEEAWAMLPKDESVSTVWTQEMREAFSLVLSLMTTDEAVAARMAFKEKYTALVSEARAKKEPPKWDVSLGHDKIHREAVLLNAVAKGRLSESYAMSLLPDLSFASDRAIPGLTGPEKIDVSKLLRYVPVTNET